MSEPNDTVHVYDVRKLAGGSGTGSIVRSFALWPQRVESCRFSPNGEYLVAATTPLGGEGMGELRVWPYETTTTFVGKKKQPKSKDGSLGEPPQRVVSFPGHTGPIVDFCFSPDGKYLVSTSEDQTNAFLEMHLILRNGNRCFDVPHLDQVLLHVYSSFHTVFYYINIINTLLGEPFLTPKASRLMSGSVFQSLCQQGEFLSKKIEMI